MKKFTAAAAALLLALALCCSAASAETAEDRDGEAEKPDTAVYRAVLSDLWAIDEEDCFTLKLYEPARYPAEAVLALEEGSPVEFQGETYTISGIQPLEDGQIEITTAEEDIRGCLTFTKLADGVYGLRHGFAYDYLFLEETKVMLPLPDAFVFLWKDENDEAREYGAEEFIRFLREGTLTSEHFDPNNTEAVFEQGMLTRIGFAEHYYAPAEQEALSPE